MKKLVRYPVLTFTNDNGVPFDVSKYKFSVKVVDLNTLELTMVKKPKSKRSAKRPRRIESRS